MADKRTGNYFRYKFAVPLSHSSRHRRVSRSYSESAHSSRSTHYTPQWSPQRRAFYERPESSLSAAPDRKPRREFHAAACQRYRRIHQAFLVQLITLSKIKIPDAQTTGTLSYFQPTPKHRS